MNTLLDTYFECHFFLINHSVFHTVYFVFSQGESTDNFNWGVRRRPLSGGEGAMESDMKGFTEESVSENTPLLTIRKVI